MTGREREARRLRTLVARLRRDWSVARDVHARLERAVDRARGGETDEITVGAVALFLQNLYTAVEELLQRVAVDVDGSVPTGTDWHRELLEQMLVEVPEVRPPLLDDSLHEALDLLRRFRHVVRHAYAEPYRWDAMQDAIAAARRVARAFPDALERFADLLTQTIAALESGDAPDQPD